MRALLIDPKLQTITEVDYTGDYKNIYEHIGADCFDMVRINGKDNIFVDDEGLINGKVNSGGMFRVDGHYPAYLAGKGLVLGSIQTDDGPDSGPTDMPIETLRNMVQWGVPVRMFGKVTFVETAGPTSEGQQVEITGRSWEMDL